MATPETVSKPNGTTATPVVPPVATPVPAGQPTYAELMERIAQLEKQASQPVDKVHFKIADKGGVSAVGIGRFPTTLYYEQWINLLDAADRAGLRRMLAEWLASGKILLKGTKEETAQSIMQRSVARGQADLAALVAK